MSSWKDRADGIVCALPRLPLATCSGLLTWARFTGFRKEIKVSNSEGKEVIKEGEKKKEGRRERKK